MFLKYSIPSSRLTSISSPADDRSVSEIEQRTADFPCIPSQSEVFDLGIHERIAIQNLHRIGQDQFFHGNKRQHSGIDGVGSDAIYIRKVESHELAFARVVGIVCHVFGEKPYVRRGQNAPHDLQVRHFMYLVIVAHLSQHDILKILGSRQCHRYQRTGIGDLGFRLERNGKCQDADTQQQEYSSPIFQLAFFHTMIVFISLFLNLLPAFRTPFTFRVVACATTSGDVGCCRRVGATGVPSCLSSASAFVSAFFDGSFAKPARMFGNCKEIKVMALLQKKVFQNPPFANIGKYFT